MKKFCRLFLVVSLVIQLSKSQVPFKVLCYYSDWRLEWHTSYRLLPKNIDPTLCTHILYAFALPDLDGGIVPVDFLDNLTDGGAEEFIKLKEKNPNLKLLVSVGGWKEGSTRFSRLSADPVKRQWFAEYSCQFVRGINFDGLDINWQWPGLREGSNSADKVNFALLIKGMRDFYMQEGKETNREPLSLSVILPQSRRVAFRGFDLPNIISQVDFVTLNTMDYHEANEPLVDHPAPLYSIPLGYFNNKLTVSNTVKEYKDMKVIDPKLMNLGIPLYGRSFLLENPIHSALGSKADDEGLPGYATNTPGLLSYYEICQHVREDSWLAEHPNSTAMGPIAHRDINWVGYDDVDIIKKKVKYAIDNGLGGISLWTIDLDDHNGTCTDTFPLTRAAREISKSVVLSNTKTISSNNNTSSAAQSQPLPTASFSSNTINLSDLYPVQPIRPQTLSNQSQNGLFYDRNRNYIFATNKSFTYKRLSVVHNKNFRDN